ncbi:MAG: DUF4880 domain-containing protein [Acetobacter sp.]|uniref:FecR family protein n=1 Tax=Acetobacter sp. TaxID=440 RepID=UPI0039EB18FB
MTQSPDLWETAAHWIARLHADTCSAADRDAFRCWLALDDRHGAAIERLTEYWDWAGGVEAPVPAHVPAGVSAPVPVLAGHSAAVSVSGASGMPVPVARHGVMAQGLPRRRVLALAAMGGLAVLLPRRQAGAVAFIGTRAGEIRTVTLGPGQTCALDTESCIAVSAHRPGVRLVAGQTLFSNTGVDPIRISTGNAVLTVPARAAVDIRLYRAATDMTCIAGQAIVHGVRQSRVRQILPGGRRLRIKADGTTEQDTPSLDELTAWTRHELLFRNVSLGSAVAEMNRYATLPIGLHAPRAAGRALSAVYHIGQEAGFLGALAHLLPVRVQVSARGYGIYDL